MKCWGGARLSELADAGNVYDLSVEQKKKKGAQGGAQER